MSNGRAPPPNSSCPRFPPVSPPSPRSPSCSPSSRSPRSPAKAQRGYGQSPALSTGEHGALPPDLPPLMRGGAAAGLWHGVPVSPGLSQWPFLSALPESCTRRPTGKASKWTTGGAITAARASTRAATPVSVSPSPQINPPPVEPLRKGRQLHTHSLRKPSRARPGKGWDGRPPGDPPGPESRPGRIKRSWKLLLHFC